SLQHLGYVSLARGYKAGGVNTDPSISEINRIVKDETNYSVETGLKSTLLDNELQTRLAVFYIDRRDQQVKNSEPVTSSGGSTKFKDYLTNAAKGRNYGLELETHWQLNSRLMWEVSYGYLNTEFVDYTFESKNGLVNKDGRAQAHAPEHSMA